jgi:hypothetical protein
VFTGRHGVFRGGSDYCGDVFAGNARRN